MENIFVPMLERINQLFEGGIAITAFSLFLRHLTFNLQDRVSRTFALVLACITIIFSGEALSGTVGNLQILDFWLRFTWIGIILLPAAYLMFADALLETTGRPSRGRRRLGNQIALLISIAFLISLSTSNLVGDIVENGAPVPYLKPTILSGVFTLSYASAMVIAASMLWRAYNRTVLSSSRTRMGLLSAGALMVAVGSFPYLFLGSAIASKNQAIFLGAAAVGNIFVFISLLSMAYAAAFFGVSWPDRIVKSRLLKWILRGPVVVFVFLFFNAILREFTIFLPLSLDQAAPVIAAITVILLEHLITVVSPTWDRWLFFGKERDDLSQLQSLADRLVTLGDLRQFLDAILAAVCDQFQVSNAFLAVLDEQDLDFIIQYGGAGKDLEEDLSSNLLKTVSRKNGNASLFTWGEYWVSPLFSPNDQELLALFGVMKIENDEIESEQFEALQILGERVILALEDRQLQRQIFASLDVLEPKVEMIQRLRAASRFEQKEVLTNPDSMPGHVDLTAWVKDALTHFWGGPKLTQSPLLRLRIFQNALAEHEGNPANAMRAILRQAIEQIRPEGERRFTAEWILYNILELKFMQGRKVRDVAMRLAVSEADLYRKQRVAIRTLAAAILNMEKMARQNN